MRLHRLRVLDQHAVAGAGRSRAGHAAGPCTARSYALVGYLVVAVADHHQRRAGIAGEVRDGQRRLRAVHAVELVLDHGEALRPVGRDGAVVVDEERDRSPRRGRSRRAPSPRGGRPRSEDQAAYEVRAAQRREQRDAAPVAAAQRRTPARRRPARGRRSCRRPSARGDRPRRRQACGRGRAGRAAGRGTARRGPARWPRTPASRRARGAAARAAPRAVLLVVGPHVAELYVSAHPSKGNEPARRSRLTARPPPLASAMRTQVERASAGPSRAAGPCRGRRGWPSAR